MAIGLSHLVLPQSKQDAQNPPEPLPLIPKTSPSLPVTLHTPEGESIELPVGNGITPAIWKKYNLKSKRTIAAHFNCANIGQFEDDVLKLGNAFINSDLTEVPETTNDDALARELAKSDENQRESTMHDGHLAKNMAASEAR